MVRALDNTPKKSIRLSIIRTIEQQHRQFARMKRAQKKDVLEKVADEIVDIAGIHESYSKKENALLPDSVQRNTGIVFKNENCETPMRWAGIDNDDMMHVFKCANDGDCHRYACCEKERLMKTDTGLFGMLPQCSSQLNDILWSRKIAERPFNLMKHRDGLEPCRMKTHKTVSAQAVFSQMVGLIYVIAGLRSSTKKNNK